MSDLASRDRLTTERRNEAARELDLLSTSEAFDLFQAEDGRLIEALEKAKPEILRAVDLIVARLREGGRLLYVGAGTSGRLGVLDAAECPPTFRSDPEQVVGLIAGGEEALRRSVEGAEDDARAGRAILDVKRVGARDVVFGISAGGTTPFVHGALSRAAELGAASVLLACVAPEEVADRADVSIRVLCGPELLAGSTRLKAGTATKLVLNRVSTLVMVRLGKVYGNLMVDLDAGANRKLGRRALSILCEITGLDEERAGALLERADGRVKVAALMGLRGLDAEAASERLAACGGFLRDALSR
jgi:N-acetylmuramic acid 6-phosphate etherase